MLVSPRQPFWHSFHQVVVSPGWVLVYNKKETGHWGNLSLEKAIDRTKLPASASTDLCKAITGLSFSDTFSVSGGGLSGISNGAQVQTHPLCASAPLHTRAANQKASELGVFPIYQNKIFTIHFYAPIYAYSMERTPNVHERIECLKAEETIRIAESMMIHMTLSNSCTTFSGLLHEILMNK